MNQYSITYEENGQEQTEILLYPLDMKIDDVYMAFDRADIEIRHIKFICEAELTDFKIVKDTLYDVFRECKRFIYGFFDIEQALHGIWVVSGVPDDYYILHDNKVWRGKRA